MRKLTSWGLLVGLLVVILGLWWSTVAATADELDSLPKSALNLDGLFEVGKFEQNAASKLAVDQGDGHTANVFELNNDNNQVGAIWSTPVNRFNLNVDNKITMLVNFGDRGAGEGLALVLQNDPRKTAAISRFGTKRVIGENLGVYGTDTYSRKTASSTIAKTAIQKSWAIEIDTKNNDGGFLGLYQRGNSFDEKMHGNHVAVNYPASPETYTQRGGLTSSYRFEQNHLAAQEKLKLNNGQWYRLQLSWSAKSKVMTYTFGNNTPRLVKIDTSVFGKEVRNLTWGVTSTSTSSNARTLVAFEQLPQPIEIESELNVTNVSQELPVHEGSWVHGGDDLEYEYVLSYLSGDNGWEKVEANIPLPEYVKFSSATVRYEDGHEETIELPDDDRSEDRLQHMLSQSLSKENRHAYITLRGEAERVEQDTKVQDDVSYFVGPAMEIATATPHFTITTGKAVSLSVDPIQPVKKGAPATVKGQVKLDDGLDFDNDGMRVELKLNGERLEDYLLDPDDAPGYVELELDPEDLNEGENELILRAKSQDNATSDAVAVTILVLNGELKIKSSSKTSTFEAVRLTGAAQTSRPKDLEVIVADETGGNTGWRLDVHASKFVTAQGRVLAGDLYYNDGKELKSVTDATQTVVKTQTKAGEDYNVTKDWSDQHGLIIKTNPAAVPGQYESTLTWTLSAVPGK
ncbi:lectin-like domain-containing protein [Lactiplantibacillus pentosus]|uniref:lectin-like domain-containing protein n=1 Tax=Lactiplantibacillus pentosus TaxID=1589 RepID=UPI002181FD7E|nr:hypothetical protein [Lactiplantibacillus pentosus]